MLNKPTFCFFTAPDRLYSLKGCFSLPGPASEAAVLGAQHDYRSVSVLQYNLKGVFLIFGSTPDEPDDYNHREVNAMNKLMSFIGLIISQMEAGLAVRTAKNG